MQDFIADLAGQFGEEGLRSAADELGITPEAAQSAISAALPAIATALAGKAAQPANAAGLTRTFGILTSMGSSHPSTMLGGLLNDPKAMAAGANMAKSLFGGQFGAMVEKLVAQTGVSDEVAGKLLGMAVPAVMGAIGTQVKAKGIDAAGLGAFFNPTDQPAAETAAQVSKPEPGANPLPTDVAGIAENLKRGLKRLFGRT